MSSHVNPFQSRPINDNQKSTAQRIVDRMKDEKDRPHLVEQELVIFLEECTLEEWNDFNLLIDPQVWEQYQLFKRVLLAYEKQRNRVLEMVRNFCELTTALTP